ncbi:uncharacterized protein LOC134210259 [Armigeres subalbatus]|uniref:uncharacterized protein LOC134210259 n=1 Tax=Armigeres subalbatus TaxID=124917 RepID=UPI002ED55EC7
MNAIDFYRQSIRILKFNSVIVGAELWNTKQFLTFGSYSIMTQMVIYFGCVFSTVHKYRHDMMHAMKVLNCAGIAFQLSVKFFIAMSNKDTIRDLLQIIETEMYDRYPDRSSREGETVFMYAKKYNILLRLLSLLYSSTLPVFALYPLFIYFSEGELIPLFMLEIPHVDWHSTWGYLFTNFLQVETYVMGLCGLVLADGLLILIAVHGLALMEILMIHLEELGEMLKSGITDENENVINKQWKGCLREHQRITEFFEELTGFSAGICLILVFTGVFAICDNLVLCVLTDWYASYLFLLVCFVQLTIYYALGNTVELKSDALDLSVGNFPWNLLRNDQQKEYLFLLGRMQQPIILTVYGFSNLNLESYMSILKVLYQFAMMIINFVG